MSEFSVVSYEPHYFPSGTHDIFHCREWEMYGFKVFIGQHDINLEGGDSAWYYHMDNDHFVGVSARGPAKIKSKYCCTVIRGYSPPDRMAVIDSTNLPYVNGCSTESLIPPIRMGDPTMQVLYMPPNSSEQQHHIHSTARVVFIMGGSGTNIYGMDDVKEIPLRPLDVLILDKMVPHHFITGDGPLFVSPFHVFSSVGRLEQNHPMFNGTHMTD